MVHQDHHGGGWLSVFTLEFPTKTNLTNPLTQRSANQAKAGGSGGGGGGCDRLQSGACLVLGSEPLTTDE